MGHGERGPSVVCDGDLMPEELQEFGQRRRGIDVVVDQQDVARPCRSGLDRRGAARTAKITPDTGKICGMEALVRWRRRDGELVMPGDFIEIAEECGLIAQIDEWVLEEACRQNRRWQDAGLEHVAVAVNLSAARTHVEAFPDFLADVLRRTRLPPECLQIELTESQMLHDTERFETLIRGIKSLGVKVAIDDFGTGYSSLGYLHRFPFDVLKIDKSFVQSLREDSREAAIVEAITRLARAFDYVVVAEGVETQEQVRILQAHGCHEMQGYLYSRPVPAEAFEQLLRAGVVDVAHDRSGAVIRPA
ncbi:EAL domain-containing protein [Lysobacter sp. TY2-98]|nr:EAL domain-containing protein [Lysobacter sp. TY2-98]